MLTTNEGTEPLVRHELFLTVTQKDALRLLAESQNRSANDLIRDAVDAYLTDVDREGTR